MARPELSDFWAGDVQMYDFAANPLQMKIRPEHLRRSGLNSFRIILGAEGDHSLSLD